MISCQNSSPRASLLRYSSGVRTSRSIDAGEIFTRGAVPLDVEHETAATLLDKIGDCTATLLRETLPALLAGAPPRLPQELEHIQPYLPPLTPDNGRLGPSLSAREAYAIIRSFTYPYPNAFVEFHEQRLYIGHARLEHGEFTELTVRAGGSPWQRPETLTAAPAPAGLLPAASETASDTVEDCHH